MRRVFALILALAMVLSVFSCVTVAADDYVAISLESNKVGYSDASETPTLKAYGVDAEGNKTLLSEGVTWESESEKVLTIGKETGTINFVTSGNGFSVVTAKDTSVGGTSSCSNEPLIESLPPIAPISSSFCAMKAPSSAAKGLPQR